MRFMRFKPFVGPQIFQFQDPDTGRILQAKDKASLLKLILSYRAQNELAPIEQLGFVVENYMCSLPIHQGCCETLEPFKRHLKHYIKGGIALLENLLYPKKVSQRIADIRATQCIDCKYNVFPDKDGFLKWSDERWEESVGDKKSKYHDVLGNCGVCSCPLRAKVWYDGKINLSQEEFNKMKSVDCWQLRELVNIGKGNG